MQGYTIRRVKTADLERILEIERASFGDAAYDRNLFAYYYRKCGSLFLVAECGRAARGYMITCLRGGTGRAELVSVAVDPAARGKGAASALLKSTLRRLRMQGITAISLMVKTTNDKAFALYERHGFHRVRRMRRYYEDGADGWLMAKPL